MTSTCSRFQENLSAYADNELKRRPRALLETHLFGCEDCRARLSGLSEMSSLLSERLLAQADDVDFSGFANRVFQGIGPEQPKLFERFRLFWSELFAFHKMAVYSSMATAAVTLAVAVPVVYNYASDQTIANVLVEKLDAFEPGVKPVVMNMGDGKTLIMMVRDSDSAPDGAPGVSGDAKPLDLNTQVPTGGEL